MAESIDIARWEATQELCTAVLTAAGEVIARHGDDPHGPVIFAAGFAMALRAIGREIDPKIPDTVRQMLERPQPA